jgi:predicted phosphodiesterase
LSTWKTVLVLPDIHVPDHHSKAIANVLDLVADYGFDEIGQLGDFLDLSGPSRWSKGTADEFGHNVQAEADAGVKILGMFRELHDGPFWIKQGNHDKRIMNYVHAYAPAIASLRGLQLANLLDYKGLDITDAGYAPHLIAPGVFAFHGEPLASVAGMSAMKVVKQLSASVVQGHTHRQGLVYETVGIAGKSVTRFGLEAGHLYDKKKAGYLSYGYANWQMGFAVLHVKGNKVVPVTVPVFDDGSFVLEGVQFG